ncbi:DUF7545 family protein [Halalkalirubrum salinum]|uniref:DUF7545 family protein n=1 Tax=Halalkalirubrum salinum TaxID=2563889 RepID=UPI0010FB1FF6|nr:hypothetical protein [Halalkalirubrum salinum]
MADTETYTIEGPEGDSDTVELPAGLVDTLAEQGEEPSKVISDIVLQALAQHAHALAHHSQGETPPELVKMNETAEELFEERFGVTLAEATGHQH